MNCFHKFFGVAVLSVVLSLPDQARAEITPQSWSAGPFVGGYYFDDHQSIKDSLVAGLRLGYALTPAFTLEGTFPHLRPDHRRWRQMLGDKFFWPVGEWDDQ